MINIRIAEPSDAEAILGIYSHYIKTTAITFEYEVPSIDEFQQRITGILKDYPYLVAEEDGKVVGYVYASRFSERKAYDLSAATSIYIDEAYHRRGIGKMLYAKLEEMLKRQNVTNLYAGAADPTEENDKYLTRDSEHFHEALGYEVVGRHRSCGNKFGKWYNLLWMEKVISEHTCPPEEFIPFSKIRSNL